MSVEPQTATFPAVFKDPRTGPWKLAALLVFSAAVLLLYSRAKYFWNDEALTYYTIHHRSLLGVLRFQASTPLVLEPPSNDVILWCTAQVLGFSKQAMRSSAMLCFLLLQWFLYRVTTLVGGYRAGIVAVGAVLITQFLSYGAECRPYALIAMLTVAGLLLWYRIRFRRAHYHWYALALAAVIALAATSQFLGAIIVLPIIVAELVASFSERQPVDKWVVCALLLGLASIALDVPALRAVRPYRPSIPFNVDLNLNSLAATYLWGFFSLPVPLVRVVGSNNCIWLALCAAVFGSLPRRGLQLPGAEGATARRALWSALLALTLIPIPVLFIAHFVTHYFQPRYAVQGIPAFVALLAITLARLTQRWNRPALRTAAVGGVFLLALKSARLIRGQVQQNRIETASYQDTSTAKMFLQTHPQAPIYLSVDACILYPFYGDALYIPRIRCLYSDSLERRFNDTVLTSLTARILTGKTDLPFRGASFEEMRAHQDAVLVYAPRPWLRWIAQAVAADDAKVSFAGSGLGGGVFALSFPNR